LKVLAINKISDKLKIMRFKMPNAAYSNRYLPYCNNIANNTKMKYTH